MKKYLYKIVLLFAVIVLASCEQIVDLDLRSVEPKLVIDASITEDMPCTVILTKTQDFNNNDPYQVVSGAIITLTDDQGVKHTLAEMQPGKYLSSVRGVVNKKYSLHVEVEGKSYEAVGTIPERVPIDSMYIYNIRFGTEDFYSPAIIFDDPKGVENFYYTTVFINDRMLRTVYVRSDEYQDGVEQLHDILFYNREDNGDADLKIGDKVRVHMQTIDKGAYTYFSTMALVGAGGAANPISNFSGNALGCFKAYNLSTKEIVITESHVYTR